MAFADLWSRRTFETQGFRGGDDEDHGTWILIQDVWGNPSQVCKGPVPVVWGVAIERDPRSDEFREDQLRAREVWLKESPNLNVFWTMMIFEVVGEVNPQSGLFVEKSRKANLSADLNRFCCIE